MGLTPVPRKTIGGFMYQYTLELYKNHSENNDLQKHITDKRVINATSRESVDTLRPVVNLAGIQVNEYNYCYVQELKRFYYIENTIAHTNGVLTLHLRVDVLMSYITDIKASKGLIVKQRDYNPYYGDYEVEARADTEQLNFEDKFNHTGEYIVVALRG